MCAPESDAWALYVLHFLSAVIVEKVNPSVGHSLTEFGTALAQCEIHRISQESNSVGTPVHSGTVAEQIAVLEATIELMQIIGSHPDLTQHAKPTISHTDLHMGNIFVLEDDPSKISAIIDWQFTQIAPLFLQARPPVFLKPPKNNYPSGLVMPTLPDNYADLDSEGKEMAAYELKQAKAAKAYELRCVMDNKAAYKAMNIPRVYRELFLRCGETLAEGPAPLRACLIEISESWHHLGLPGECPYAFDEEDMQIHQRQWEEYEDRHHAREFAQEYLDTDADGWISPEVDFAKKQEQNKALFHLFVERMANQKSLEEVRRIWPFAEGV